METMEILTLALGAAVASGVNLYATVVLVGCMGLFGVVDLPPGLEMLENPMVLIAAAFLYCIEFVADKIPVVDSVWDVMHTFVRIPAGALIAANAVDGLNITGMGDKMEFILALLAGGTLAAGSHATKAASRAVINTSPEPFTNIAASLTEDVVVFGGMSLALFKPVTFLIISGVVLLVLIWLLPKLWRGIASFFGRVAHPASSIRNARQQRWSAPGMAPNMTPAYVPSNTATGSITHQNGDDKDQDASF